MEEERLNGFARDYVDWLDIYLPTLDAAAQVRFLRKQIRSWERASSVIGRRLMDNMIVRADVDPLVCLNIVIELEKRLKTAEQIEQSERQMRRDELAEQLEQLVEQLKRTPRRERLLRSLWFWWAKRVEELERQLKRDPFDGGAGDVGRLLGLL